jgi:hypothetical protein
MKTRVASEKCMRFTTTHQGIRGIHTRCPRGYEVTPVAVTVEPAREVSEVWLRWSGGGLTSTSSLSQ